MGKQSKLVAEMMRRQIMFQTPDKTEYEKNIAALQAISEIEHILSWLKPYLENKIKNDENREKKNQLSE